MEGRAVRIRVKDIPTSAEPAPLLRVLRRSARLTRLLLAVGFRLPQSRLRRWGLEWMVREFAAGSFNRRDYALITAALPPDFKLTPSPEMGSLLGHSETVWSTRDLGMGFLRDWFSVWEDFRMIPREVVDLGGRRLLLLNDTYGSAGGLQLHGQKEAELWDLGPAANMRQWWGDWDAALRHCGVEPDAEGA